jgi:hypothetical protein
MCRHLAFGISFWANNKSSPTTCLWRRRAEMRYSSYSFTTSTLDGVSGQHHAPAALYPLAKDPWYPLDRRLVHPTASLDIEVRGTIIFLCRGSNLDHPVCSQTLYWLSYSRLLWAHNSPLKTDAPILLCSSYTDNGVPVSNNRHLSEHRFKLRQLLLNKFQIVQTHKKRSVR